MVKNDEKIIELKDAIAKKKEELKAKNIKPNYTTNLVLDFEGHKHNLNVLDENDLNLLLIKLETYNLTAVNLGLSVYLSDYTMFDWISDIYKKINLSKAKEEEMKLKTMESKLTLMLSDEKKTEIELDEIAAMLKN